MKVSIVYDGLCPACRQVVTSARLHRRGAELELVDARAQPVADVQGRDLRDLDFDEGLAVVVDGEVHHGAEGAQVLAALTETTGLLFHLFRWLMATKRRGRFWYPMLRAGRNLLLRVLRVPKFREPGRPPFRARPNHDL